ncbi:hypothetical protein NEOKW01_0172 [Nematocida sp. AWRm80]|nr:hypothetical protein NEOKW01_0172 [Nematocida sp. AWRm80]
MSKSTFMNEIRGLSLEELQTVLSDKKRIIMNLRNESRGNDVKRTAEWINTKKNIARCMFMISEKKKEEIKAECEKEGKPLPKKLFTKKLPRKLRVSIDKATLKKFAQRRPIARKIVVFKP